MVIKAALKGMRITEVPSCFVRRPLATAPPAHPA
jgi:hypothetical protein